MGVGVAVVLCSYWRLSARCVRDTSFVLRRVFGIVIVLCFGRAWLSLVMMLKFLVFHSIFDRFWYDFGLLFERLNAGRMRCSFDAVHLSSSVIMDTGGLDMIVWDSL